jgi:hypothetical protein
VALQLFGFRAISIPASWKQHGIALDAGKMADGAAIGISPTDGETVGTAACYRQFIQLAQRRIAELGLTADSVDELCGFSDRYCATLLSGGKSMSVYSFFTIARALALLPTFAHDHLQLTNIKSRSGWHPFNRTGPRYRPGAHAPRDDAYPWIGA